MNSLKLNNYETWRMEWKPVDGDPVVMIGTWNNVSVEISLRIENYGEGDEPWHVDLSVGDVNYVNQRFYTLDLCLLAVQNWYATAPENLYS